MDTPNIPAIPAVPAAPVANAAPAAPIKAGAPVDAKAGALDKAATPAAVQKAIDKIKLGEGEEYTVEELRSFKEKSKGADRKLFEASQMRKEGNLLFKMAKENPLEFLRQTGHDPRKLSYDEVAKDIQDKLRDPRDVELDRIKQENEQFKAKENAEKDRIQQEKLGQQAKALEQRMHSQAIAALEAHPAIPKNGFSVARMAKYLEVVQQKTGELLSFEDVAGVIEADIKSEAKGLFNGASADQIIDLIGPDAVEAIRQHFLSKLKDPLKGGTGATNADPSKAKPKFKDSKDFWKTIDRAAKAERGQ